MLTATPVFAKPVEAATPQAGWMTTHPRYRAWLRKCGLESASEILALRGEVVCGHADRHVVKVELHSGVSTRYAYLKREHVVGRQARFRNWLAGFGYIPRAEREARTLQKLEELGLPGPQWLAYGEDAAGKAFLLVEELSGSIPLREYLADNELSASELRLLAERLGRMLAECHAAEIGTPELSAKHILIRTAALQPTLIDWQSSRQNRAIRPEEVAAWFGALHATLPADFVSDRTRLRLLWAYRRVMKASGKASLQTFARSANNIGIAAQKQSGRSSVRQQLGAIGAAPQRLVWVEGEAAVAIPEVAMSWPANPTHKPFYGLPPGAESFELADGRIGKLIRFRSFDPVGRIVSVLRERPWRSPAADAARALFHLQRFGIVGPKLLAFGQRQTSLWRVESFVIVGGHDSIPQPPLSFAEIGRFLHRLHEVGCSFRRCKPGEAPLLVLTPELERTIRVVRRISARRASSELAAALVGLDHPDKMQVLLSYSGST